MRAPSPLLAELGSLVERAGRLAQETRQELRRELKPDGSIVTNADRAVEEFLREELPKIVADTTVWGEEFGYSEAGPGGVWAVDPVDGTSNFAFGSPLWGVSAGLALDNDVLLGAVALPDLGELYLGERGGGAFLNGQPLPPILPGPIQPEELVSYCDPISRRYPNRSLPGKMRCSGSFVIDGTFVACQRYRGLVGIREKLYDVAACLVFAKELTADVRYLDGSPFSVAELTDGRQIERPWVVFPTNSGFTLVG